MREKVEYPEFSSTVGEFTTLHGTANICLSWPAPSQRGAALTSNVLLCMHGANDVKKVAQVGATYKVNAIRAPQKKKQRRSRTSEEAYLKKNP